MAGVLLLRAPSTEGRDKYESAFESCGYDAVSVPVLETALVNLQGLAEVIHQGPQTAQIGGIIITSARACEAWAQITSIGTFANSASGINADWSAVPCYVVGEATATAVSDLQKTANDPQLVPQNIRGRDATGTAEKLAYFILEDYPVQDRHLKMLYLTGDKNRETLPKILSDGGITLQALKVYETQGSSTFESNLKYMLASRETPSKGWWIVYFAPSAAAFVTPILQTHFPIPDTSSTIYETRLAAIGPTTSSFLQEDLHLRVDVVASKPSPEILVNAIRTFDNECP